MNKMAIFVEGYTELVFIERLIGELAGRNKVVIETCQIKGGTSSPRRLVQLTTAGPLSGQRHYILIYDCGGDDAVKTRMREEYDNLARSGYSRILCVRDVYPNVAHAEIPKLEVSLPKYVKTKPIAVDFILAIMEIEAWFLAEYSHFPRIDPSISVEVISARLGFNPKIDDMQLRQAPASDLDNCYAIAGKSYVKGDATNTCSTFDYSLICLELVDRIPYLGKLVSAIETFVTANDATPN